MADDTKEIWVYEVEFKTPRKQIGDCHFSHDGKRMTDLKAARMFTYADFSCLYLMYEFIDGDGESYFDDQEGKTFAEMVENAMDEAEEEFGIKREEWKKLTND